MRCGRTLICLIAASLCYTLPGWAQTVINYKALYTRAETLSNAADHDDQTDQQALQMYREVVDYLRGNKIDDAFLFKAEVSTGAFLQVLGRQPESITYLNHAIALKSRLKGLSDSVLFKPLVYCGNAYYTMDRVDTAETYYKHAAAIADRFPNVSELERLYNTLGVVSYSKGNYSESIAYYQKAISTLKRQKGYDNNLLVTYQSNQASALRKMHRYPEALNIYLNLLPYKVQTDQVLHNIGSTYLGMGQDEQAILYLNRVSYQDQKKLNDLALGYMHKKDYANTAFYLDKATELNSSTNKTRKNSDYAITLKYRGDLYTRQNKLINALGSYQQAIGNLLPDLKSTGYYTNPANFSNAFNGLDLLEILSAKADAFKALYTQTHKVVDLQAALDTYNAFYALADHIARFYETDESRLVVSSRKYLSRDDAISISLQLFKITANPKYAEKAFALDEENKAGILSLYLEEAALKQRLAPTRLLQDEHNLKQAITRLSLKAAGETDTSKLATEKIGINDLSIRLIKAQHLISEKTGFELGNNSADSSTVARLQKRIPSNAAILSYHVGTSGLVCFAITHDDFRLVENRVDSSFFTAVTALTQLATQTEQNNLKQMRMLGQALYQQLIKPAGDIIGNKKDLLIIPDNALNFLPFDLLANDKGERLLNTYAITYNYSCTILLKSSREFSTAGLSKLAMAPFAGKCIGTNAAQHWDQLPASGAEVQAVKGTAMTGQNASKTAFLKNAPGYDVIHLATHAVANDLQPDQSFIAFYPAGPDSAYKLFMPEIYNLQLSHTRLIVLSACESGAGKLAQGEGIMSLSRAFSYSGCDNIVTSMWKADDQATAYLSGKFYTYLDKGYTIAQALRQAKLDYIDDPAIGPAQKLPGYWAHLRLIGTFQKPTASINWIWCAAIVTMAIIAAFYIKKGRPKFRRPITKAD